MKPILVRIFIFCFLFSFHSSFAQTITKKRGKVTIMEGGCKKVGKVKNYKKVGVWKTYDVNGKIIVTQPFTNDTANGIRTCYYPSGKIREIGFVKMGKLDGNDKTWFENGVLSNELNYSNGDLDGIQKSWYDNGQLQSQSKLENKKYVYWEKWYRNGRPWECNYFENGLADGTYRYYGDSLSKDTFPTLIINYSNGKKDGVLIGRKNGLVFEEIYYKNDLVNGSYKYWDWKGVIKREENYVNGKLDGVCTYYNLGKPIRVVHYKNGLQVGLEKQFQEDGKLIRSSWFKLGVLDSTYTYHTNGNVSTSRVYSYYPGFVRTEEFSIYKEFDEAGHLLLKGKYHFENKDGEWTTYYPTGKVKSITMYAGAKAKVYKKWYANGKQMIEYELDGATIISTPKVWDEKGKVLKSGTKAYQEIVDSSLSGEMYYEPNNNKRNGASIPTQNSSTDSSMVALLTAFHNAKSSNCQIQTERNGGEGNGLPQGDLVVNNEYPEKTLPKDSAEIFSYAEEMPRFPGDSMFKFIKSNINYSKLNAEKSGRVYVGFVVEKDGSLTNIHVVKSIPGAPEFDVEAIRIYSIMPKWIPGKMHGKPVRVSLVQPIPFYFQ